MHSLDLNKRTGLLKTQFEQELEIILKSVGTGLADFSQFVFPRASFHRLTFQARCVFDGSAFTEYADFSGATFEQDVDFSRATFEQDAHFHAATFKQNAIFTRVRFKKNLCGQGEPYFQFATFEQTADFAGAIFEYDVSFKNAKFMQDADFAGATFTNDASFEHVTFSRDVNFGPATVTPISDLGPAKFLHVANFSEAKFLASVRFRETKFRKEDGALIPGPVFSSALFSNPEAVTFYGTDLTRALFLDCDVTKINFSLVEWRKRPARLRRFSRDRCMVFEEVVNGSNQFAAPLKPRIEAPGARNYRLIEQLYRQLKKNHDDKSDYGTAGDFHYGEMEMKRLDPPEDGRFFSLRYGLRRRLGLVAWYKYASQYGESYLRPFLALILTLFFFASLFPVAGLQNRPATQNAAARASITYRHPLVDLKSTIRVGDELKLWGNSFLTALNIAAIQKELVYEPAYPWGRLLALLELLVTSTLIALFLLAVNRRFRR